MMAAIYDVMVETQVEFQSRAIYILRDWVKKKHENNNTRERYLRGFYTYKVQ